MKSTSGSRFLFIYGQRSQPSSSEAGLRAGCGSPLQPHRVQLVHSYAERGTNTQASPEGSRSGRHPPLQPALGPDPRRCRGHSAPGNPPHSHRIWMHTGGRGCQASRDNCWSHRAQRQDLFLSVNKKNSSNSYCGSVIFTWNHKPANQTSWLASWEKITVCFFKWQIE